MSNQVRVIDNISGTTLFQTSIEKLGDAYSFAALMEEQGLDIRIDSPGVTEGLISSLGADDFEMAEHKKILDDGSDDYMEDSSCTICPPITNLKIQK